MAISEFETKRCEKLVSAFVAKRRPPPRLRDQVDLGFRITGQSIEIFEVRPRFDDRSKKIENGIAKASYNKTKKNWRVFWQRADLKWHLYDPAPVVRSFENFLALVDEDTHGCFFG